MPGSSPPMSNKTEHIAPLNRQGGLTERILVARVVLQYPPVHHVAQLLVHVDGHLVAHANEQIDEVGPLSDGTGWFTVSGGSQNLSYSEGIRKGWRRSGGEKRLRCRIGASQFPQKTPIQH